MEQFFISTKKFSKERTDGLFVKYFSVNCFYSKPKELLTNFMVKKVYYFILSKLSPYI